MATLSGFTRPSDPINADQIAGDISTAISKIVTVEVTPTDVLVTGSTLVSGDTAAVQAAITASYFRFMQFGVAVSDNSDMSADRHGHSISEHAAYSADVSVASLSNKAQHTGSTVHTGAWPILRKATTNSSGVAVIYLTTDGTSGTAAAFGTVLEDGIVAMAVGANNYQVISCVLSGDRKTLTVTLNQISTVLGVLTFATTAGAGIEVRAAIWGKS